MTRFSKLRRRGGFAVRCVRLTLPAVVVCGIAVTQRSPAFGEQSTDKPSKVTYEDDVKPIFRQHCLSCHNQGDAAGGLALDSFTAMMEGGGSGEVVYDDGDVQGSRLWQLVNHDDTPVMPPNQDKIAAEQLQVIRSWLELGALENAGSKAKVKKKNALAMASSGGGKPDGPAAMPQSVPQQVPVVTERASAVTAIGASPWAPLVAVAGQQQIVLYHAESSELLGVLPFPEGIPHSLRFSRDGAYLIAGGGEHAVKGIVAVYDVKTGERVATVGDEYDVVFDGDVNDNMSRVALGGPQKMLRIFDATDGELLFDIKKHTDWIYAVAYSPDGVLVASADRSGGLHVWEAETGRLYLDLTGHKGAINSLAWRDDSNVLASAGDDGSVKLWDMHEGKLVKSVNAHNGGAMAVHFDHDGRFVTAGKDNRVRLWDPSGNKVRDFEPMGEAVLEVAITHDAGRVAYGDWTGAVLMASVEDPKEKTPLAANPPPIPVRIEEIKTTLASIRSDLNPLKESLDRQQGELAKVQKPLTETESQVAKLRGEAGAAEKKADEQAETAKRLAAELPQLTRASRDSHDKVIAGRLAAGDGAEAGESVAAAEIALAEQLTKLAEQRRRKISLDRSVAESRKLAATKLAEAETLEKKLPALQEAVAKVESQVAQAKAAHDRVARQLSDTEAKMEKLAAEIR